MKTLFLILVVLFIGISSSADYGPITMREGANITLDGGYLVDAKMGESGWRISFGSEAWCDFVTDGSHDETTIQSALDYAESKGIREVVGIIGNYSIEDQIKVPERTWLHGVNWPRYWEDDINTPKETRFSIKFDTNEAIELADGSAISQIQFVYPGNMNASTWADVDFYPATIDVQGDGVEIAYCQPLNPYHFINSTKYTHIRTQIHHIDGYFLHTGINLNGSVHGEEVSDCNFLPSLKGMYVAESLYNEIATNGTAIRVMRSDGLRIRNIHAWQIGKGIYSPGNETHHLDAHWSITDCMLDELPMPIYVYFAAGGIISNNAVMGARGYWSSGANYVDYGTTTGYIGIRAVASTGISISGNAVRASLSGIDVYGSNNIAVGNNVVGGFAKCTDCAGASAGIRVLSSQGVSVDGNTLDSTGAVSNAIGIIVVDSDFWSVTDNVAQIKLTSYGVAVIDADNNNYIIATNNLNSTGLYNMASAATTKVIEHNLW